LYLLNLLSVNSTYFDSNNDGDVRQMSFRIGNQTLYDTELSTNFDSFFIEAEQSGITGFGDAHEGNYVVF